MRWESLRWLDPTYQTTKRVKFSDELRISGLAQPTKHTLSVMRSHNLSTDEFIDAILDELRSRGFDSAGNKNVHSR
jgi:hypothetical protein